MNPGFSRRGMLWPPNAFPSGLYHLYVPDVDWIREFCLSFPDTTENMQWGEDLCFKVHGKMFTVVDLSKGKEAPICFKCTPEKFQELLEIDGIAPAPYVGRYKWVLLDRASILNSDELENLIRQSYKLVIAKLPKKKKTVSRKAVSRRHTAK
jgi:predicted DNA-binding protein (MmcQ/YjbR family)